MTATTTRPDEHVAGRPWLVAFAVALVLHLVLLGLDVEPWDSVTKCLLAPLLVGWVLTRRGPRLLAVALVLCLGGDLLLELDEMFLAGMASFAAAHVCFVALFVRAGAWRRVRPPAALVALYLVAAVVIVVWAWSGLEADLRPVVPVYAALLLATAASAAAVDRVAGVGGGLFLVSDGVIALGEAGRVDPGEPVVALTIMSLYGTAIALLALGGLRVSRGDAPSHVDPS